jgi:succinate dehydrogenase / fumarate reductase cytochrome b subunit
MNVLRALSTTVGSKFLVALTGLLLVGFLVAHLAGNLLILLGGEKFNAYGHALINNPLVIPAELGLMGLLLVHMFKALAHVLRGSGARPEGYQKKTWAGGPSRKSWASTTMALSGIFLFAFLIVHIATFKFGPYYASTEAGVRDLQRLVVEVFKNPLYAAGYVVAMGIVGMHLRHGVSSAFQSLGLMSTKAWTTRLLGLGLALAVVIAGGFAFIPVWVYLFL